MKNKTKGIIGGIAVLVFSWVFAIQSVGSPIEPWYVGMSMVFAVGGIIALSISSAEL